MRLRGVVTWVGSGDSLVLQSGDLGVRIRTEARDLPPILTEIEAITLDGFVERGVAVTIVEAGAGRVTVRRAR